jgi:hypothetical protein
MFTTTDSVSATFAEQRASWGAIIAGAAVALGVQVLLAVLGIAIGASVIDPLYEADPVEGIGIGAGIYFLISATLAVLAGGYVAGALSRIQERRNRTLHGLATWSAVTLLSVLMLATGLGRLVGGTMSLVGAGLSQAGDVASAVAGSVAGQGSEVDVEGLRQEARELAQQPGELRETAEQLGDQATDPATREEWEAMKAEAEQRARELGQEASEAVATAAWWTFFMLVLTAVAAAVGANLGANRAVVAVNERITRT